MSLQVKVATLQDILESAGLTSPERIDLLLQRKEKKETTTALLDFFNKMGKLGRLMTSMPVLDGKVNYVFTQYSDRTFEYKLVTAGEFFATSFKDASDEPQYKGQMVPFSVVWKKERMEYELNKQAADGWVLAASITLRGEHFLLYREKKEAPAIEETAPSEPPSTSKDVCPKCGKEYNKGAIFARHLKACTGGSSTKTALA